MDALNILQTKISRMDHSEIKKDVETIAVELSTGSIIFVEHPLDKFRSVPQLKPYCFTSILIAKLMELIEASIVIPARNHDDRSFGGLLVSQNIRVSHLIIFK
jgi:hypothetical protein